MAIAKKNISRFVHYSFFHSFPPSLSFSLSLSYHSSPVVRSCDRMIIIHNSLLAGHAVWVRSQRKTLIWTIARLAIKKMFHFASAICQRKHVLFRDQATIVVATITLMSRTCSILLSNAEKLHKYNDKNYLKEEISSSLKLILFASLFLSYYIYPLHVNNP